MSRNKLSIIFTAAQERKVKGIQGMLGQSNTKLPLRALHSLLSLFESIQIEHAQDPRFVENGFILLRNLADSLNHPEVLSTIQSDPGCHDESLEASEAMSRLQLVLSAGGRA